MKIDFDKNKLYIDGKETVLDYNVSKTEVIDDKILVLLDIPMDDDAIDNLYCFKSTGALLWRIKEPRDEFRPTKRLPYELLTVKGRDHWVVDFMGFLYYFDIETGEITGSKFVR